VQVTALTHHNTVIAIVTEPGVDADMLKIGEYDAGHNEAVTHPCVDVTRHTAALHRVVNSVALGTSNATIPQLPLEQPTELRAVEHRIVHGMLPLKCLSRHMLVKP
jgi:hypothetical protein